MKRFGICMVLAVMASGMLVVESRQKDSGRHGKKSPREVVEGMFAAFNRHDAEGMATLYSEDAFIDSPEFEAPKRGKQGVREIYAKYFRETPDIRDTVTNIFACGDKVFVEFVASGTIPGSNGSKMFSLKIATALEVSNGEIVRDVTYFDRLAANQD
ncbi:MAG TPA: nuclear transport factor 2 family protein [Pyrinomonadaceae bacterium]|nr:nuclear transport factor 2 family protein [Pyrinomonadaceae bacterium]